MRNKFEYWNNKNYFCATKIYLYSELKAVQLVFSKSTELIT